MTWISFPEYPVNNDDGNHCHVFLQEDSIPSMNRQVADFFEMASATKTNTTDSFALANSTASTINFKDDLGSKEEPIRRRRPVRAADPENQKVDRDRRTKVDAQLLRNADRWKLLFGQRKYELLCAMLLVGLWRLWQPIEVVVECFPHELFARTF